MDDDAMATVVSFVAAGILFVSCCSAVLLSATGIEHLSTAMDPGHALAAHTVFDNFVRGSLMKAQGVLDGTTVASLLPGDSMVVDPNDGRMSYGEARALLGVPANQHFNLLVINADGSRIEFGAPLPEHTPLDGASGMFCLDLCPSAGGSVATVRLFFFDGDAATATTSTSSAPPTTPPPTQANLLIAALAQSPLAPRVGDATAFTATVSNLGLAATPAVPLVVRFLVDGTSLGTSQATGPLAVGASVQVVSPTWTAAGIGAHTLTATVDPFGAVGESSEADNDATLSFAVAAGVQTLIGAADPGYAFVDTNRDNLFTTGTDTPIAAASIPGAGHNLCSYDAGAQGLVIPASVGPIAAASCSLKATKNLLVGVNLTATGTLDVAAGDITVQPGKVFDAKGALTMLPDTSFVGSGSTFRSAAALRIGSGSPGQLDSSITLVGATLDTTAGSGSLTVAWQNGDLGATNAKLLSKGAINLGGANKGHQAGNAVLSGATVDNTAGSGALAVQYVSGAITATGSSTAFRSKGAITLAAGTTLDVSAAAVDNSGGSGSVAVSGTGVTAKGTALLSKGQVDVTAGGAIVATGATLDNSGGNAALTVQSTGGAVDLGSTGNALVASKGVLQVLASTGLTLTNAVVGNGAGGNPLTLSTATGSLLCNPCSAAGGTSLSLSGGALTLTAATLAANAGSALVSATGALSAANLKLTAAGNIGLTAVGVTLDGACATASNGGALTVAAGNAGALSVKGPSTPGGCAGFVSAGSQAWSGKSVNVNGATFQTTATKTDLTMTAAGGAIDLTGATFSVVRNLVATVPSSGGFKVTVTNAALHDANDKVDVPNPTGTYSTGTPKAGYGVE